MRLIIHATNIHQGGGRTLLLALLSDLRRPAVAFLDERLSPLPDLAPGVDVVRVAPRIMSRLISEYKLRSLCRSGDTLLCFGNLPPLFKNRARVLVYLQNRYLSSSPSLSGLRWSSRIRIRIERLWLRYCLRDAALLVQTETMALEAREQFGVDCSVLPFFPMPAPTAANAVPSGLAPDATAREYDFLYVASGEPHKNHRRLIDAWIMLSKRDCYPSLCLTLDVRRDAQLLEWIEMQARHHGLQIANQPLAPDRIGDLYRSSGALIYPSLFESFGLPLLEARAAGIPIVAAERDYVRDVVLPVDTFDPESARSIARAVLRHLESCSGPPMPIDAASFLQQLGKIG